MAEIQKHFSYCLGEKQVELQVFKTFSYTIQVTLCIETIYFPFKKGKEVRQMNIIQGEYTNEFKKAIRDKSI